jgi:anti-sigma regulatory factor (Ser/Thr protein kinase)
VEARTRLAAEPRSAWLARGFVTSTLTEWGVTGVLEPAALLTSELVTNAVVHARSDIELVMRCEDGRVRIEVVDRCEDPPVRRSATPEQTSGRGLALVDALALSWGVNPLPEAGKSIWFEVPA